MALTLGSWWWDLCGLGCGLLLLLYVYFRHSYTYWKKRGVPYMEPTFPFGNIRDIFLLRRTVGEVYGRAYDFPHNGKLTGIFLIMRPAAVLRDLETIKHFLVKDFANFTDRGFYFNEKVDPINAHLFFLTGQRWKNLRAKLTPTFTSGKMKMMFQTLLECADELKAHLNEPAILGEVLEIKDILARFTTDVISSCAFGIQCNCLKDPDAEFRTYGVKFFNPSLVNTLGILLNFMTPSLAPALRIPSVATDVKAFFSRIVSETIEYRENNRVQRKDFMQLMIRLKNTGRIDPDDGDMDSKSEPDMQELTMQEIVANAFVFFIAGFETSSTAMGFCLYELACKPSIQDRLRQEIDSTLKKHGALTYEAMQDMVYLDKVVSETLRKYPPVPILNRECTKRYRMPDSDVVIEPGVALIVPVLGIHHDPRYYPDPQAFDPERFSEEAKASRPHFSYLPFGDGPRNCIGLRFGLMQTKVGVISMLSQFQFNVCEKTVIPLVMDPKSFILTPPGGIFLRISRRSDP